MMSDMIAMITVAVIRWVNFFVTGPKPHPDGYRLSAAQYFSCLQLFLAHYLYPGLGPSPTQRAE